MTKEMGSLKVSFISVLITLYFLPTLLASIVSTGDFNNDFIVKWSPSHVTTSSNGQARTLKLDQESGETMWYIYIYIFVLLPNCTLSQSWCAHKLTYSFTIGQKMHSFIVDRLYHVTVHTILNNKWTMNI